MKRLLMLTCILTITSCATTYQAQSWTGGFTETQLDTDVYSVRFKGNGYTSSSRAADFTLLRSAEIALEQGYNYFVVIESDSIQDVRQASIPQQTYNYGTVSGSGGSASYSGYGTTYQNIRVTRPTAENTILLLKEKPAGISYNAQLIYDQLREQYGLDD
jgi:hypothetical protein